MNGQEKKVGRRRGGKTILKSGQGWTLPAQLGQLKTGQDGEGLLQSRLLCLNDLARLWERHARHFKHCYAHIDYLYSSVLVTQNLKKFKQTYVLYAGTKSAIFFINKVFYDQ